MLRRQPESRAMNGRFRGSAARVCSLAMTLHRSVRRQGARGSLHAFSSVQIASPWGGCNKGPRAGRLTSWRQQPHHMCSHARVLCSPFAHPPDRCRRRPYSPPLPEPRSQEFVCLPLPANAGTFVQLSPSFTTTFFVKLRLCTLLPSCQWAGLQNADFRATDSGSAVSNVVLRIVGNSLARAPWATDSHRFASCNVITVQFLHCAIIPLELGMGLGTRLGLLVSVARQNRNALVGCIGSVGNKTPHRDNRPQPQKSQKQKNKKSSREKKGWARRDQRLASYRREATMTHHLAFK